ncbi:MAG: GNAT family N-acetyltransferase [Ruminiclostridium sp.]
MRIDIRAADKSDIPAACGVINDGWRVCYSGILPDSTIERYANGREESLAKLLSDSGTVMYVLECDKAVRAVCTAVRCTSGRYRDYANVVQLYVAPNERRKGLGRKLLSHTLRALREKGYKNAVLDCLEKNTAARRFYEKFGFEFVKNEASTVFPDTEISVYTIEL